MTDLYLLEANDKYKIGFSDDVESRVDQLQTGNPYEISVEMIENFDNRSEASNYEEILHNNLESQRLEGEWFDLSNQSVALLNDFGLKRTARILEKYNDEGVPGYSERVVQAINLNHSMIETIDNKLKQTVEKVTKRNKTVKNKVEQLEKKFWTFVACSLIFGIIIITLM